MSGKVAETVTKPSGKIKPSHHHIPGILKRKEIPRHLLETFCILLSFIPQSSFPFPVDDQTKENVPKENSFKEVELRVSFLFYFISFFFHLRVFLLVYILWADSN